jgi:hypothetical protein
LALVEGVEDEWSGDVDPVEAVAEAKINRARSLDEALTRLHPDEQAITLARPLLFSRLCGLPQGVPVASVVTGHETISPRAA